MEKFRTVLLIACALVPLQAHADPIRITSGTVSLGSDAQGRLRGRNFFFFFDADLDEPVNRHLFAPSGCCEPGRVGSFRQSGTLFSGRGEPTIINGREFESGRLEFAIQSPNFVYPEIPRSPDRVTISQPFTFTGIVTGFEQGTPQFRQDIVGSGQIELSLQIPEHSESCGPVRQCARDFTYFFESSAAPIPEPGTLLLFGSALGGVAALRRKKR